MQSNKELNLDLQQQLFLCLNIAGNIFTTAIIFCCNSAIWTSISCLTLLRSLSCCNSASKPAGPPLICTASTSSLSSIGRVKFPSKARMESGRSISLSLTLSANSLACCNFSACVLITSSTISVYLESAFALLSGTRLANIFSLLASNNVNLLIASRSCAGAPFADFFDSVIALTALLNRAISSAISSFSCSSKLYL